MLTTVLVVLTLFLLLELAAGSALIWIWIRCRTSERVQRELAESLIAELEAYTKNAPRGWPKENDPTLESQSDGTDLRL